MSEYCNPSIIQNGVAIQATGPRTVIIPADPIEWSEDTSYEYLTLVASTNFGQGYISKKDVPSGTPLTNTDYWIPVANFNAQLANIQSTIASLQNDVNSVTDTITNIKTNSTSVNAKQTLVYDDPSAADANKAALQLLIDNSSTTGGTVVIPKGTVYVNGPIILKNHSNVIGEGTGTIINFSNGIGFTCDTFNWNGSNYDVTVGASLHSMMLVGNFDYDVHTDNSNNAALNGMFMSCEISDLFISKFSYGIVTSQNINDMDIYNAINYAEGERRVFSRIVVANCYTGINSQQWDTMWENIVTALSYGSPVNMSSCDISNMHIWAYGAQSYFANVRASNLQIEAFYRNNSDSRGLSNPGVIVFTGGTNYISGLWLWGVKSLNQGVSGWIIQVYNNTAVSIDNFVYGSTNEGEDTTFTEVLVGTDPNASSYARVSGMLSPNITATTSSESIGSGNVLFDIISGFIGKRGVYKTSNLNYLTYTTNWPMNQ